MSVCSASTSSKELGNPHPNAHAYRLYIFNVPQKQLQKLLSNPAAISEALNYNRTFYFLSTSRVFTTPNITTKLNHHHQQQSRPAKPRILHRFSATYQQNLETFFKASQHYHPQPQLSPKSQNHQSKKNQSAAKPSIMTQLTPPTQTL